MATPYFQLRFETVASTQDLARKHLGDLPVLVIAQEQTAGRGREGTRWLNADRALAASLAVVVADDDRRPFSLMAGVAATRAAEGSVLKWPNDVMADDRKVGGILVERSGEVVVIGLGLNLWWAHPVEGASAVHEQDPGEERHAEIGALWGAELMRLLDAPGWPREEYLEYCATLGREITWEPQGSGKAVDISADGGLVVESPHGETRTLYSGAVRHLR